MKRRKRLEQLPFEERLKLLRNGVLSEKEIADLAADVGTSNYIQAKSDVEKLLDHPNPIVRYNAIGTLTYEWNVSSKTDRIVEIALRDPDSDCRRRGAASLGSLFSGTRDSRILAVLVSIAKNPHEEEHVRAFAYTAALDVIGVPFQIQPNAYGLKVGGDELAALEEYLKAV